MHSLAPMAISVFAAMIVLMGKPQAAKDEKGILPIEVSLSDVSSINPSLLGYTFRNDRHHLSFALSPNFYVPFGKGTTNQFGFGVAHRSAYDFDTDSHSGPVISRVQNPMGYLGYRVRNTDTSWRLNVNFGFAHESNGMFVQNPEEAALFDSIDGNGNRSLSSQDYASMGWNYWFATARGSKSFKKHIFALSVTYRYHVEQKSFSNRSGLEDTTFLESGHSRPRGGIKGVDGFRVGVFYKPPTRDSACVKPRFVVETTLPEFGYWTFGSINILNSLAVLGLFELPKPIPTVYMSLRRGYMDDLAHYYDRDRYRVAIGVALGSTTATP